MPSAATHEWQPRTGSARRHHKAQRGAAAFGWEVDLHVSTVQSGDLLAACPHGQPVAPQQAQRHPAHGMARTGMRGALHARQPKLAWSSKNRVKRGMVRQLHVTAGQAERAV